MYFSNDAVVHAIETLRNGVHPFFGITFLACKKARLPVGQERRGGIDGLTRKLLEQHHKPLPESAFYFQPYRSIKFWVDQKYPSSGLQAINTQTFGQVFLHQRGSGWAFAPDYVSLLSKRLTELGYSPKGPLLSLAIWVYKDRSWPNATVDSDVIEYFINDFNITEEEKSRLFYVDVHDLLLTDEYLFQEEVDLQSVFQRFPPPPDAPRELGGALRRLRLEFVGPSDGMEMDFGERLTIVTGDNGLGKSFLLETAWWATTGHWAGAPAFPFLRDREYSPEDVTPSIEYEIEDRRGRRLPERADFDWRSNSWVSNTDRQTVSALSVFARVDGSFAIFDPVRQLMAAQEELVDKFTQEELWTGSGKTEGLIRDWVRWELSSDQTEFERFKRLLAHLSPEDLGTLRPGETTRLPRNPRPIPTIRHRYGETPIVFASAGVKRILGIAYLIIWAWSEHRLAAQQTASEPLKKLVLFVDEVEAHLHPKWQRIVLPALLRVGEPIQDELDVQIIAATHSPLVMASTETIFSEDTDRLYHFELTDDGVELVPLEYAKFGDAASWLTSSAFGLRYARSREAEKAIERAKALQQEETPSTEAVRRISNELRRVLAPDDKFWPRWLYFAEQHDVIL